MTVEIKEVTIIPVKPNKGLVALASCVVDDKLYLGSIGLYTKKDGTGYRLTYPNKKIGAGSLNIYHPINKEVSDAILDAIVEKYEELMQETIDSITSEEE